jgi:hypothetical protein
VVLTIERLCKPGFLLQNRIVNNHDSFTVELPFTDKSKDTRAVRSNCVPIIFAGLWLACYVDYIADCLLTYFGMPKSNTCMYGVLELSIKAESRITRLRDNCRLQCQPVSVWGPWPSVTMGRSIHFYNTPVQYRASRLHPLLHISGLSIASGN